MRTRQRALEVLDTCPWHPERSPEQDGKEDPAAKTVAGQIHQKLARAIATLYIKALHNVRKTLQGKSLLRHQKPGDLGEPK